jgi:hypothetical protein
VACPVDPSDSIFPLVPVLRLREACLGCRILLPYFSLSFVTWNVPSPPTDKDSEVQSLVLDLPSQGDRPMPYVLAPPSLSTVNCSGLIIVTSYIWQTCSRTGPGRLQP